MSPAPATEVPYSCVEADPFTVRSVVPVAPDHTRADPALLPPSSSSTAPAITSSTPSPSTSPASATDQPMWSSAESPRCSRNSAPVAPEKMRTDPAPDAPKKLAE
jgi:hypothetical protein